MLGTKCLLYYRKSMANGETNTIYSGSMFSGKTTALISRYALLTIGEKKIWAAKPQADIRVLKGQKEPDEEQAYIEARPIGEGEVLRVPATLRQSLGSGVLEIEHMLPSERPDYYFGDELHMWHPEDVRDSVRRLNAMNIGFYATSIVIGANLEMQPSVIAAMEEGVVLKQHYAVCKNHCKKENALFTILRNEQGQAVFDGPHVVLDTKGSGEDMVKFTFEPACADYLSEIKRTGNTANFPEELLNSEYNWSWDDKEFTPII